MSPAEALAALEEQLAEHGQPVTLRRPGSPAVDVELLAWVTESREAGEDSDRLGGHFRTFERQVVISPSHFGTWPGALSQTDGTDPVVPLPGDVVLIDGRAHTVIVADPRRFGATLVRINLTVRG